jgi:hypothetical protein
MILWQVSNKMTSNGEVHVGDLTYNGQVIIYIIKGSHYTSYSDPT